MSRLRRAALAARLALRLSSAASWIVVAGLARPATAAAESDKAAVTGAGKGSRATGGSSSAAGDAAAVGLSGLPGLVRPVPVHPVALAVMKMGTRLRARAGLPTTAGTSASTTTPRQRKEVDSPRSNVGGGGGGGGVGALRANGGGTDLARNLRHACGVGAGGTPMEVLVETVSLVRGVFETADDEGFVDERGLLGSGGGGGGLTPEEGNLGAAVCSLLERGLAVVAYR